MHKIMTPLKSHKTMLTGFTCDSSKQLWEWVIAFCQKLLNVSRGHIGCIFTHVFHPCIDILTYPLYVGLLHTECCVKYHFTFRWLNLRNNGSWMSQLREHIDCFFSHKFHPCINISISTSSCLLHNVSSFMLWLCFTNHSKMTRPVTECKNSNWTTLPGKCSVIVYMHCW